MISIKRGNIFSTNCDCIVNTINCVGYMGKGIALEFSIRYPEIESLYKSKCELDEINIGSLWFYNPKDGSKSVLNFPTKNGYKYPSKLEYIEKGLRRFCEEYKLYGIESIAFPVLGSQNGGIDHELSLSVMKEYLGSLDDINIEIYIFDRAYFKKDKLFNAFLSYLDYNTDDKKITRIREILSSRDDIYTFSDITEKKIPVEQEDGSFKRSSIATKQFLQKIVLDIKMNDSNKQKSFFEN